MTPEGAHEPGSSPAPTSGTALAGVTTSLREKVRRVAIASALALAVLASPALQGQALAVDDDCSTADCQRWKCTLDGKTWNYSGGDVAQVKGVDNKVRTYMCDGRTGKWIQLRTATDMSDVAPLPTTAAQ